MVKTDLERVWGLMKSISFCMLSNWDGRRLRSRPMGAFVRPGEGAIYFFTDDRTHTEDEIRRYPKVCLAFADVSHQKYVSVYGTAEISCERSKMQQLWAIPAKVWWRTPDNPHIRLIKVIKSNLIATQSQIVSHLIHAKKVKVLAARYDLDTAPLNLLT